MEKRSSIIGGIILILVGAVFLSMQMFPDLTDQLNIGRHWPLIVVAVGSFFLLGSLLGTPPLAVPGSIIAGIGGILYYQNLTGNWASWAFVWALIPGFVGVGMILMGLLSRQVSHGMKEGGRLLLISVVMFAVFGAFFSGFGSIGRYWPVLLILAGGWLLITKRRRFK